MAIVKVKKFNLISFKNELNALLSQMQEFVEVDFRQTEVDLKNISSNNKELFEEKIYKIESILKKIRKYEEVKGIISKLKEGKKEFTYDRLKEYVQSLDLEDILTKINESITEEEYLKKQNETIESEIYEYSNWKNLDIVYDDISKVKNKDIVIGSMSKKNFEKFKEENLDYSYTEIISENKKEVNLFIISLKEDNINDILRTYNFNRINLDLSKNIIDTIKEKENRILNNKEKIEKHISNLKELSKNILDLEIYVEYYKNELLKEEAKEYFKHTENINIVSGYIPLEKEKEFVSNIENVCKNNYYLTFEEFDENSKDIPIKLKNNEIFTPFESLTATFSMPRYTEIDPTMFVAPAFWLFFGMMIGDLGYGLIMVLGAIGALSIFNLDIKSRISVKFLMFLGISTSIWGILYGSFFGFTLNTPLHFFSPTLDYKPVMNMSIIFGVIHILLALSLKAFLFIKDKKYLDALYEVGFWVAALFGTGMYIYKGDKLSLYIMIISMLAIIATGGRSAKSLGGKVGLGLYALYGISGYLGDLISYVRLMALGLSGGFIAYAINIVASMVGYKSIAVIFTIIILILGHVFNLFLSMLGAYVHTSRLIYVEFFSKFYQGGGKAFKDFKIKEKYINIKK